MFRKEATKRSEEQSPEKYLRRDSFGRFGPKHSCYSCRSTQGEKIAETFLVGIRIKKGTGIPYKSTLILKAI